MSLEVFFYLGSDILALSESHQVVCESIQFFVVERELEVNDRHGILNLDYVLFFIVNHYDFLDWAVS